MEDNRGGKERGRGERRGGRLGIVRLGAHRDNRPIVGLMRFEFEKASPLSEPLLFPKRGLIFSKPSIGLEITWSFCFGGRTVWGRTVWLHNRKNNHNNNNCRIKLFVHLTMKLYVLHSPLNHSNTECRLHKI
jgi:hypothetical protein